MIVEKWKTKAKTVKKVPKKSIKKVSRKKTEIKEKKEEKEVKKWLNPKQEFFCQLYATNIEYLGNWTQAYAMAYWKDLDDPKENKASRNWAYENLTKPDILERIRELQNDFLSEEMVDKELSFVALQRADLSSKMRAISEFNKLKKRITEKMELKHTDLWEALLRLKKTRKNKLDGK